MSAHQLGLKSICEVAMREPESRAHHCQFHQCSDGDGFCHFDPADALDMTIAHEYGKKGADFGLVPTESVVSLIHHG